MFASMSIWVVDPFFSNTFQYLLQVPPIVITSNSQSPVLGSPDSDGDILGFIDHTPDPLPDSTDCKYTHSSLVLLTHS